jgi:hypothetical protein
LGERERERDGGQVEVISRKPERRRPLRTPTRRRVDNIKMDPGEVV